MYYPHPLIQDLLWDGLYIFTEPFLTRWPLNKLREKALQVTMKHIHYEDENSRYITIGCVEKVNVGIALGARSNCASSDKTFYMICFDRSCACLLAGLKIHMEITSRSTWPGFQIISGLPKME